MKVTGKFLALALTSWAALGELSSAWPVNALKELSVAKSVSVSVYSLFILLFVLAE